MQVINLKDKVVVVTGGAQGIGKAIVNDFAREGATAIIADLNEEAGQETATAIAAETGQPVHALQIDVSDLDSVQSAIGQIIADFGRIDVLVNNAGWDKFGLFLETTPELWDRLIAVNLRGLLNMCYTVLPHMVAQKSGSIVNLASDAGRGGSMGESVYAACKAASIAFSKTIAREHARDNIRVNVVAPGITDTSLLQSFYDTELGGKVIDAIARSIPLGRRPAYPDEISPAVLFFASDAARYITGQVLSVSGGLTMVD